MYNKRNWFCPHLVLVLISAIVMIRFSYSLFTSNMHCGELFHPRECNNWDNLFRSMNVFVIFVMMVVWFFNLYDKQSSKFNVITRIFLIKNANFFEINWSFKLYDKLIKQYNLSELSELESWKKVNDCLIIGVDNGYLHESMERAVCKILDELVIELEDLKEKRRYRNWIKVNQFLEELKE
jgi:hypothetical protein